MDSFTDFTKVNVHHSGKCSVEYKYSNCVVKDGTFISTQGILKVCHIMEIMANAFHRQFSEKNAKFLEKISILNLAVRLKGKV